MAGAAQSGRALLVLLLALTFPACRSPTAVARTPLALVTQAFPSATRGEPYAEAVHAAGGDGAYFWEIQQGTLPVGLVLTVDDLSVDHALISGTPDRLETATFTILLRSGDGQAVSREFSISVLPEPVPLAIHTRRLPPALRGGPYNVQLRANGGDEVNYDWSIVDGRLPAGLTLTAAGQIQGTPTTVESTSFTLEVRSGNTSTRWSFTLRVVLHDTNAFRITTFAVTDIPPAVQPHIGAAIALWESAIVGNLPAVTIPQNFFGPSGCGGFGASVNGTSTDDVLIMINIMDIDGPGGVLGRAGPCGVRSGTILPFVGILTLDVSDLMAIVGTETLTDIIAHEIAHVLGFGTLWGEMGLLDGAGSPDPRFTGARATAEYQALGGTGTVPLETQGGAGTRDSHWRKSVFNIELMTGFAERVGISQPASRVTLAQWQDMGYVVNMAAARPFSLTRPQGDTGIAGHGVDALGHDEVYRGPVLVLHDDGRSSVLGERR
jgi:hypothetical protein